MTNHQRPESNHHHSIDGGDMPRPKPLYIPHGDRPGHNAREPGPPPLRVPSPHVSPNQSEETRAMPQPEVDSQRSIPSSGGKPHPGAKKAEKSSLFWPGFALSLLLLSMVSCGALSMLLNINPIQFAQIRSSQVSWYPPEPALDFLPENDRQVEGAPTVAMFEVGQQVQNLTNSRVNIRRTPGYLGKTDDDILYQIMPSAEMEILDEPAEIDGLTWWHIRYTVDQNDLIEGWVAEATASGVQILGNSLLKSEP